MMAGVIKEMNKKRMNKKRNCTLNSSAESTPSFMIILSLIPFLITQTWYVIIQ